MLEANKSIFYRETLSRHLVSFPEKKIFFKQAFEILQSFKAHK